MGSMSVNIPNIECLGMSEYGRKYFVNPPHECFFHYISVLPRTFGHRM